MRFLTNEELRNEVVRFSELGYNYVAFNSDHVSGFRTGEASYLTLGCYRKDLGDTCEKNG